MKVLVVDDHILFREGLCSLLNAQPDVEVLGGVGTVKEAIETALVQLPDVILMDYSLPDGTGAEATRAILAKNPNTRVLCLTVSDDDETFFEMIRSGVKGFLLKNLSSRELMSSLDAVRKGEAAIPRLYVSKMLEKFSGRNPEPKPNPAQELFNHLTDREKEVLNLIVVGATNDEIAAKLFISGNTVKNHVHNLMEKIGLSKRRELKDFARQAGLIE